MRIFSQAIQQAVDVFEQKNETFKLASKELSSIERVSEGLFKVTFSSPDFIFFGLLSWKLLNLRREPFLDGGTRPPCASLDQGQRGDGLHEVPGAFQRPHQATTPLQGLRLRE